MGRFDALIGQMGRGNPLRSVADYEKEYAELDAAKQAMGMNKLKVDEYRRGIQRQNELQGVYGGLGADQEANYQTLLNKAGPDAALKYRKGLDDSAKTGAETKAKELETQIKRVDLVGSVAKWVMDNPSVENATAGLQNLAQQGVLPADQLQGLLAQIGTDPAKIKQGAEMLFRQALAAKDQLPKNTLTDLGGEVGAISQDMYGKVTPMGSFPKSQSPDNAASNARMAADAAANRAVQMRGQNIAERRAATTADEGKIPPGYRKTADGNLEPIPGGPAAAKAADKARAEALRGNNAVDRAGLVIDTIDKALDKTGFFTTGLTGAVVGAIPGTKAYDLRRTVDTVKANIGFGELQAMREASPTGGALGQVAVQELMMLQAVLGNLDANQSEADVRANLEAVKTHFENWKNVMKQVGAGGIPNTGSVSAGFDAPAGWSIKAKP